MIYSQHDKAFQNVSAFAICKINEHNKITKIATVSFKFPTKGEGRLCCYFHVLGCEMVRGFAGGYGYDKESAATSDALGMIVAPEDNQKLQDTVARLKELLANVEVLGLDSCLWDSEFTLIQAV